MSEDERQTMEEVSHTHPYTGKTFGGVYRRGPAIADGGESVSVRAGATTDAAPESDTDADREREKNADRDARMRDVDHESSATANEVWARGGAVSEVADK